MDTQTHTYTPLHRDTYIKTNRHVDTHTYIQNVCEREGEREREKGERERGERERGRERERERE